VQREDSRDLDRDRVPRRAACASSIVRPLALAHGHDGVPVFSLDLVGDLCFALLTGAGGEGWTQPAAEASARTGVPVRVHVIGGREGVTDPYGEWAALREVETTGCVLVRPDRQVAWRSPRYTMDGARQLPAVIEQALGLHPAAAGSPS